MDPLQKRLDNLWQSPDFYSFFEKYAKRPPIKVKKNTVIFFEGDQPDKIYFVKNFIKVEIF
mgnify:FL=1